MIPKIGGAEGLGFPDRRHRDQGARHSIPKPEKPADTTPPKRRRSSPGENWGGNLDIDV